MKSIKPYLIIVAIATLFLSSSLNAKVQTGNVKIYDKLTLAQILNIMKDLGYNATINEENGFIRWMINATVAQIIIKNGNYITFYTYEEGGTVTLKDVNDWNNVYVSKMQLDDDEDIVLEIDMDITGGVTEARIIDFINGCQVNHKQWLNTFASKIGPRKKS
jgi:hypothetical protein